MHEFQEAYPVDRLCLSDSEMRQTVVDMNGIVDEARGDLQLEVEGREIVQKVDVLLEILGAPAMLRIVLRNLLSKAVKCREVHAYPRPGRDRSREHPGGPGGRVLCPG